MKTTYSSNNAKYLKFHWQKVKSTRKGILRQLSQKISDSNRKTGRKVQILESPGLSRRVDSPGEVAVCLKRGTCGFTVLRYWAFFKLYCGNFDFNVRCWGIIQPCGMQFFILLAKKILHSIAVPFIWPLLSHVGQHLADFRHNGKWLHNIVTVTLSWYW